VGLGRGREKRGEGRGRFGRGWRRGREGGEGDGGGGGGGQVGRYFADVFFGVAVPRGLRF
jgi:hypothetical protein